jgi:hypothetical protein
MCPAVRLPAAGEGHRRERASIARAAARIASGSCVRSGYGRCAGPVTREVADAKSGDRSYRYAVNDRSSTSLAGFGRSRVVDDRRTCKDGLARRRAIRVRCCKMSEPRSNPAIPIQIRRSGGCPAWRCERRFLSSSIALPRVRLLPVFDGLGSQLLTTMCLLTRSEFDGHGAPLSIRDSVEARHRAHGSRRRDRLRRDRALRQGIGKHEPTRFGPRCPAPCRSGTARYPRLADLPGRRVGGLRPSMSGVRVPSRRACIAHLRIR